jgi:hypothetical protein
MAVFTLIGHYWPTRDFTGHVRKSIPETATVGRRKKYPNALRKAVQEIMGGDGPEEVRIYMSGDKQPVAICQRQYRQVGKGRLNRGGKFSVVCTGEKPAKAPRRKR